jgi:precorrin-8X/cobalt-precorrin-8 methylmutase
MLPNEIESQSFAIIDGEAGRHGFDPRAWNIVRRMIHTSADFDYIDTVRIHERAIDAGISAIRKGMLVVTDTNMIRAGVRKKDLGEFGCEVVCLMEDPKVAEAAWKNGTTRALAAVDEAVEIMEGGIYVVGNAPTALLRLISLIRENKAAPALLIGLPVGFVNAAESKAALLDTASPISPIPAEKAGQTWLRRWLTAWCCRQKEHNRRNI